ncbi:MAG: ribosome silencing factor [Clostridia bacterium]|nr:ribosome silencing factor [Clostridia bacterium]
MELAAVEISELTTIADAFVMATATSNTHVRALADAVEEKLSAIGVEPHHIEGKATDWILLDYGCVVVHVFGRKSREFYALDHMWDDGAQIDVEKLLAEDK